jgi:glycosyltransferase involved in cell wall biosynthesis
MGDFECLLVNNNSTDKSPQIAGSWPQKDSRFILLNETRQGVVFASNAGAKVARGQYVCRMDADDQASPHKLELQNNYLDAHKETDAVAGWAEHIGDPDTSRGFARYVEWSNSVQSMEQILNSRFIEAPIINPTAMWRKETALLHGMYRKGPFPEDYEMWLRWLHKGVKIVKIPEVVLKWHDSEERLTRTHPIYSEEAFYFIKSHYLAKWLAKNNPHHPVVAIWGASIISRRRARILWKYGIQFSCYIDIRRDRQLDKKIMHYKDLPPPGKMFILVYIKQMDAREQIKAYLTEQGYTEGKNFVLVS